MSGNYHMLIASLPYLPRVDKADRLPISREKLLEKLKMLTPEDYQLAIMAADFIAWRRQPSGRTNNEIITIYNKGAEHVFESPILKPIFELPVNQKTIMTALRMKELQLPRPNPGESWGTGPLVQHIERNWNQPYFKLNYYFPWIVKAQAYLRENNLLKLEHMLMNQIWNKLDLLLYKNYFGFEVVIAYLLKWDILQQWLSYNREAAKTRFNELVMETIDEYEKKSS